MATNPRLLRSLTRFQAPGFNPKSISGLVGWWDFSDAARLGPTSTGPGAVANNDPIKFCGDKSDSNFSMVQTGADSAAPTYLAAGLNERGVAGFDGGDSLTANFVGTLTSQTIFAVARLTSAASSNVRLLTQSNSGQDFQTSGHYIPLLRNTTTAAVGSWHNNGVRAIANVTYDTWFLACNRHTGSQIQNRINNGAATTFNASLNLSVTRLAIGGAIASGGGAHWRDRIAEVLYFNRSLTDDEMNAVARWLGRKWGITVA